MDQSSFDSAIEEIKKRLSLADIAETYISLKKSGKNYIALCPFHDDKNPSLHINEEKGLYHCFSCGAGGDIFSFLMNYKQIDFKEAVRELAAKLNIKIQESHPSEKRQSSKRSAQLRVNQRALIFFQNNLLKNRSFQEARDYLVGRGINIDLVKEFKLGFAEDSWNGLLNYLKSEKIPLDIPLELGLIKKNKNFYDVFRHRIIFPIIDVDGDVIGFGGRVIDKNDNPKYLNSPESDIYKKRKSFYGLFRSKEHIKKQKLAILVEGYMDFLSLYSSGIKNVVATLGTSFTSDHASFLKRYTENVVVLYDGDSSGMKASLRSGEILLQAGINSKIARITEGFDPDLMIRSEKGIDTITKLIENARETTDYVIEIVYGHYNKHEINRNDAAQQLVDFGEKIANQIDRSDFIRKASIRFSFRENDLYSMLKTRKKNSPSAHKTSIQKKINNSEMLILKILLNYPQLIEFIDEEFVYQYVNDNNIKKILTKMISERFTDISKIINNFKEQEIQLILSNAVFSSDEVGVSNNKVKEMFTECVNRLKLKNLRDQLALQRNELGKNPLNEKEVVKTYKNLLEQERLIKSELHEI